MIEEKTKEVNVTELIAIIGYSLGKTSYSAKRFWSIEGIDVSSLEQEDIEMITSIRKDQWATSVAAVAQALESVLGKDVFDKDMMDGLRYSVLEGQKRSMTKDTGDSTDE